MYSCTTPEYLPEKELYEYLGDENHGVSRTINTGGVTMKMTYRPNDFLIWQELDGEEDSARIKEVVNNYSQYLYFVMQLQAGEQDALYGTAADQSDFSDKLQTLSFRMPQYINMTTAEQDTIPLADAYYSRMFGMSKSSDVLLVFNAEQVNDDEWISINSKEFGFKTGRRSFRFRLEDLRNTPKLTQLKPYYELIEKN
ncbi:hypothetical protein [Ekhidna sp.]|jgi:hypothetical protein|uniref:hypothetical protein n=1 Tax=Ekhidna sp. TaxID=2608089 RepID=UPI0032ED20B5